LSTYVIGDVQGCYQELQALLAAVRFDPEVDAAWFVGDLINRGPDNLATLQLIRSLPHSQVVLGNHDLHFLAVAAGCQTAKKGDTLSDLLTTPELPQIIDWLRQQPLLHYVPDLHCAMVHAGVPPIWSLTTALARADEVQRVLRGPDYIAFLSEMYGNEPSTWTDDLAGVARLRLITNYFTRMRYCSRQGDLELQHKTDIAPTGYAPWFSYPPRDPTLQILFGHWAAINGETDSSWAKALDTGCVWGRTLTALCLEDGRRTQVPAQARMH
jgi:bis(5'-nucleosyl)-tetraphosphatase (symmetrical)